MGIDCLVSQIQSFKLPTAIPNRPPQEVACCITLTRLSPSFLCSSNSVQSSYSGSLLQYQEDSCHYVQCTTLLCTTLLDSLFHCTATTALSAELKGFINVCGVKTVPRALPCRSYGHCVTRLGQKIDLNK